MAERSRAHRVDCLVIISYGKTGLDLKFERAFVLVVEKTLGLSAATLYNKNITNFHVYYHRCQDGLATFSCTATAG